MSTYSLEGLSFLPLAELRVGMTLGDGSEIIAIKATAKQVKITARPANGVEYSFRQPLHKNTPVRR